MTSPGLSLLDLPQELRDIIFDLALEARATFAYGLPHHVEDILNPVQKHDPIAGSHHVLRAQLEISAPALLCTSQTVAAEAKRLLCGAETACYLKDVNDVRGPTFNPSTAFRNLLRRSRFIFNCTIVDVVVFLNQLPRSMRQHITSIVLTRQLMDKHAGEEVVHSGLLRAAYHGFPLVYANQSQFGEYSSFTQTLLGLRSLREVAVHVATNNELAAARMRTLLGDLCHAVYSGRLQILYCCTSNPELRRFQTVWMYNLRPPPREWIHSDSFRRLPGLLDVHYSLVPIRGALKVEDWGSDIGRYVEAPLARGAPSFCGLWTDFPDTVAVFTFSIPAGRRDA